MSDSDFEQLGLSDLESVDGDQEAVVVEMPKPFHQVNQEQKKANNDESSDISHSSVPVRKLGKLNLQSSEDNSSWSHVETSCQDVQSLSTWNASADNSVAASSTISGFDYLSLSGDTHRRCKQCTYLSHEDAGICEGCGVALVANPCLDIDLQVAKNLQLKEEKQALKALQLEEKKRKSLGQKPLFIQAQVLASDIIQYVESRKIHCFKTFSITDLVLQASSFIHSFHNLVGNVSVAYHFSEKDYGIMDQIRRLGFGANVQVSKNIDAALSRKGNKTFDVGSRLRSFAEDRDKTFGVGSRLSSIPEDRNGELTGCIGWIVAVIETETTCQAEDLLEVGSETAVVTTLKDSTLCLPLVSFDASLIRNDSVSSLAKGLSQICVDFFHTDWSVLQDELVSSPPKKPKPAGADEEFTSSLEANTATLARTTIHANATTDSFASEHYGTSSEPPSVSHLNLSDEENIEEDFFW